MIPEGKYRGRAVQLPNETGTPRYARLKTGKSDYVEVVLRITEGAHAKQEFVWHGYLTVKAIDRTLEQLRYLGLEGDDLDNLKSAKLDNEVEFDIRHDTYKGKTTAKVGFLRPFESDAGEAAIVARAKKLLKQKADPFNAPEGESDDLPF